MSIPSFVQRTALAFAATLLFNLPLQASERTLDSANGPLTLSGTPQRVVALGDSALDAALSLGVQPVGTLASRGGNDVPDYLKAKAGAITLVGSVREPNLEAILRLQPDLVLASSELSPELYAKLSLMAPTVVPKGNSFEDWRITYATYAQALDKAQQGQQRIAEIDARSAALRQRLPQGQAISVVRWNPQGPVIMSSHLFVGQLLADLGLRPNALAAAQEKKPHSDVLSLENLSRINADWIFLATLNPDGRKALDDARKQPAFTRLKAVAEDQVMTVDGQIWSSSSGYLAAQQVLDDVEKALLD
ncbi:putative siderophore-binding lipoprotein YfiY precursor [Pseudomonas sp. THAF187a]|uniref:ABC transporter substrate-binding protein n=1 Tax=Ectopseudomonas khazarica TaxID=2502979 RepID=A0ABW7M8B7_9GAMM|nr:MULTISPECIES: iron-siderophore ABC transporter substrate-binding protein [unclassified Pseudomonas]QFT22462.1 putative siderophore-binding lipoprotein YfiY precursor [Pseudomonas sp. THAF187a]QFT42649.1 putative siderophore-binding lipoprotein YfiY precursor [Pseudomonas sp. THAF42]TNF18046.1 MAG: iron-siderophore ABC transporter substrate-binding protein [Pseudomonadales bacterium]